MRATLRSLTNSPGELAMSETGISRKTAAEYQEADGVQTLKIARTGMTIYVIPSGQTTFDVDSDEHLTVISGTIRYGKNQFVTGTKFRVYAGTAYLSCDAPASFRRDH